MSIEQFYERERPRDADGFTIHFTGGFRASKISKNGWRAEPFFHDGKPCTKGDFTQEKVSEIARLSQFKAIAFQSFGWRNGTYFSHWAPIIPGKTNHSEGPSQLWSQIAGNLTRTRSAEFFEQATDPSGKAIAETLDAKSPTENLALNISLSLKGMDANIERIAERYFEQLQNHMATGDISGQRIENDSAQAFFADVHSFFLHLGAARDYLAALVAHRVGMDHERTDSFARLIAKIRADHLPEDALLQLFFSTKNVSPDPKDSNKFVPNGWIRTVTSIRNELVHKRPYGSKFDERFGRITSVQIDKGLFRYTRLIEPAGHRQIYVLDFLHFHYQNCLRLFEEAALATGLNADLLTIDARNVVRME